MKKCLVAGLLVLLLAVQGCGSGNKKSDKGDGKKHKVAFVTNGVASFWDIAKVGAEQAGKDFGVEVLIRMPSNEGVADQKRQIENLLSLNVDGIAVSPIDPDNQTETLDLAADNTNLITHDSDAPDSKRICYVGMSNYKAGRMCGELVKQAIPDGGKIMIFVGRVEQLNAKQRRQGLIDELMDRSDDPERFDETDKVISNDKYTILGTKTDKFDFTECKRQAEEAIAAHGDLACMVGLFAYNPTQILEALKSADKLGKIKVVGFDEEGPCLQAIIDGHCEGTVVQDPYRYGYESVKILAGLAKNDRSVLPKDNFLSIPARKITKDNVEKFWADLKANLNKAGSPAEKNDDDKKDGDKDKKEDEKEKK